jgi:thiamine biosynthesis lipoprotein
MNPIRRFVGACRSAHLGWLPAIVFGALGSVAASGAEPWHVFHHERVLGTSLELRFAAATSAQADAAEAAALAEIDRLAEILSGYDATSEFRQWVATKGEPRRVSAELFEVLALFDTWRERTSGALDASAEVAGRLWRSAAHDQHVPSAAELAAAIASIRQAHWRLDAAARTATHLTDAPLMLNSFAKSYIIDRACARALAAGRLETAIVNLGGDLAVRGAATDTVWIADPVADAENDAPLTQIAVRDRAVATSGGYRRGVEIAGRWYSHLVDPRTARPVDHVRSATVVAPRATDAGALATSLCVMAPDEGLRLVATVTGAECLLILNDGRRLASAGWTALETPLPARTPAGVHAAVAPIPPASGGGAATWDADFELAVNLEIATTGGGRAKRPFVAVWIEDQQGFPVRTIALWYHGDRWLPDLRAWNRADQLRRSAEGGSIVHSVSSATRSPGKYLLKWDGTDAQGRPVPRGRYTVNIEVAREHGTHQVIHREVDFAGPAQRVDLPGNYELASLSLDYRRKAEAH